LPKGLTHIGDGAFEDCCGLQEICLPDSLTELGHSAFRNCISLKKIDLSNTQVSKLHVAVFWNCSSIENVVFPSVVDKHFTGNFDGICFGESAFSFCKSLKIVKLPYGMTNIPFAMFSSCERLEIITIPPTVKTIGFEAFFGCGFAEFHFPDFIEEIDGCVFDSCPNLRKVTYSANTRVTKGNTLARTFPKKGRENIDGNRITLTWPISPDPNAPHGT
jgi:hypothetical protein